MKYLLIKALLVAGTALDSHSSWKATSNYRFHEGNPILATNDGRYRTKGIAINIAIAGGVLGFGEWRTRKHPEEKNRVAALEAGLGAFKLFTAERNYVMDAR